MSGTVSISQTITLLMWHMQQVSGVEPPAGKNIVSLVRPFDDPVPSDVLDLITEESALRREVEAVGFKLVAEGDFWRHPEDPRDFSIQPPSGRAVDEFVLKFQKSM